MLRFSNLYESRLGRNDGNPLYVQACLKRMQFYSEVVQGRPGNKDLLPWFGTPDLKKWSEDPRAESSMRKFFETHKEAFEIDHIYPTGDLSIFGDYDLNIWVDWGEDGLTGFLPYVPNECPKPMAYWASDTHLGYDYRLMMAKKAQFAFCAQKQAVFDMKRDGVENPIWLPHAFEPLAYPKSENLTKHFDVCFIGHVNSRNREDALERLFKEFPNFDYGQSLFEGVSERFGNSKIVFNIAMKDDINMRCFEVMGTGSFLLTDRISYIEELFEDKKHLVLYDGLDDMIEKANYYLKHEDERNAIAQTGYEHVMKNHTMQNRMDVVLGEFMKLKVLALA